MSTLWSTREREIADEILHILPTDAQMQGEDRETITFRLGRSFGVKLTRIVFVKASLLALDSDPDRAVKIEYLQRDIMRSAARRIEYRYPRIVRPVSKTLPFRPSLSLVSALG